MLNGSKKLLNDIVIKKHKTGGPLINVLPVHSQNRGKIFLPFIDEDPKTAEIISKVVLFARDEKIKDPYILDQL